MTGDEMGCGHHRAHTAMVSVVYMEDTKLFVAEVTLRCKDCGVHFRFRGLPEGFHNQHPTRDASGEVAQLPMLPSRSEPPGAKVEGFEVRVQ